MTDKAIAFICFCLASMIDARVTEYMISLGICEEFNPLMILSMQAIPHGMWVVKIFASICLLFVWRKLSLDFLIALDAGMCAVTAWNCMLLSVWYITQFIPLESIGC